MSKDPASARFDARGRTRPGRLRRLDAWLLEREGELLREPGRAPVVDLGLGDEPATTREWLGSLREGGIDAPLIAVEIDPQRIARARRLAPELDVRHGGFALPIAGRARLVRVMNVLRGYPAPRIPGALAKLAASLQIGGLIVEGRTCAYGHVLTAQLLRRTRRGLWREALLLSTDFARGFAPNLIRAQLPAELHRRGDGGVAMASFFEHWQHAFGRARERGERDPRTCFVRSAQLLAQDVAGLELDVEALAAGHLVWAPARGLPPGPLSTQRSTFPHTTSRVAGGDNPPTPGRIFERG